MNFKFVGTPKPIPNIVLKEQPGGKRFYVTPEGNKYPSITTVLSHNPKKWLEEWRSSVGHTKAKKITEDAGFRGDEMHLIFNKYLKNLDVGSSHLPIPMQLFRMARPYLNKISNIRCLETPIYSDRLKIAGTVDCIADYNNVLSVIDFKSSTRTKLKENITDYFCQATAYAVMYEELTGEPIDNIVIIISVDQGLSPLIFKETIDKYIKELFKSIKNYRAKKNGTK